LPRDSQTSVQFTEVEEASQVSGSLYTNSVTPGMDTYLQYNKKGPTYF